MTPVAETEAVVVYSGGTDSTCAAALAAERHSRVHLLTFHELATRRSPVPAANVERLRARFGAERFVHRVGSTDRLVRWLGYEKYLANLARSGLLVLSTPGNSSLSWHIRAIAYCLEHGIGQAYDGLTRELMHFPGHTDFFVARLRDLYARFGIRYENPVRDWDVPPDQQLLDRLIVDYHGYSLRGNELAPEARTTGRHLHELGLLPAENVKGSRLDQSMQHDCYPFVLYNILVFWVYVPLFSWKRFERRLRIHFDRKFELAEKLLAGDRRSPLFESLSG